MKEFNACNILTGFVVTVLTGIFGVYWYIFATYMLLNVLDWISGWYNARKKKEESSKVGIKGIVKKIGYWVIIAVAFLMSNVFVNLGKDVLGINLDFLMMIGWWTLACLMVNEVRSILENLVECGYNIPTVLVDGLKVADEMINKESEDEEL
jgi:toxin secretion/phage lysis holin